MGIAPLLSFILVTAFGAVGDGETVNTRFFQAAIDAAAERGGGTVVVPAGHYVSGTLFLRSRVTLQLEPGAVLLASTHLEDYTLVGAGPQGDRGQHHFLVLENVEFVTIRGGEIDGQGSAHWLPRDQPKTWAKARNPRVSPLVEVSGSSDVRLEGVTIRNSPGWTCHFKNSDRIWVRDVRIDNDLYGPNTDGIDINGCRDVVITGCHISTGDDAIVLKATADARSCERVVVSDCVLRTHCAALKLGTESHFDMRDISFSNTIVYQAHRAIALYCLDGATYERISFSNIVGNTHTEITVQRPIHFDLRRRTEESALGVIRDVLVSGCSFSTTGRVLMTAEAGAVLERVTIRDLTLTYPAIEDPVITAANPQSSQFSNRSPDAQVARAAVVMENMEDVRIEGLRVNFPDRRPEFPFAVEWAKNVTRALP